MFTIKVTYSLKSNPGSSQVKIYQANSVEIVKNANTSFKEVIFPNDRGEEIWIPVGSDPRVDGTEKVDSHVSIVVIENMAGKTTEVVKG